MAEQLQALLEKIQADGIEKAQKEADRIIEAARAEADRLIEDARQKASELIAGAEQEQARAYENGRSALHRAAQQVILSLGGSIQNMVEALLADELSRSLTAEYWAGIAQAFIGKAGGQTMELILPDEVKVALLAHINKKMGVALQPGINLTVGQNQKGIRLFMRDKHVEVDASPEQLAVLLMDFVRPAMAEIIENAAKAQQPEVQ